MNTNQPAQKTRQGDSRQRERLGPLGRTRGAFGNGGQGSKSDSYQEAKPGPRKALCTRKRCVDFILKH